MVDESANETSDSYLEHLKSSRKSPAVLKIRLANLRAEVHEAILAFEGDDDKIIYSQWIGRVRPSLQYVPFPCGGKKAVLQLKDITVRDRGNIGEKVYFFVDRDFDDLAGFDDHERVFMTDMYSVENYLVSVDVLGKLLTIEFHCHERPDVRRSIQLLFERTYAEFLQVTKEINRRIFVARQLGIVLGNSLPDKINSIARVNLNYVTALAAPPEQIITYTAEASAEDWEEQSKRFDGLNAPFRYRGKFSLMFFQKWLEHLAAEYKDPQLNVFLDLETKSKVRSSELVVSNYASKSDLPAGFREFIESVE